MFHRLVTALGLPSVRVIREGLAEVLELPSIGNRSNIGLNTGDARLMILERIEFRSLLVRGSLDKDIRLMLRVFLDCLHCSMAKDAMVEGRQSNKRFCCGLALLRGRDEWTLDENIQSDTHVNLDVNALPWSHTAALKGLKDFKSRSSIADKSGPCK